MIAALALAGCAPLRVFNSLATIGADYRSEQSIPYAPGARQKLDVYQPKGTPPTGGWPLVVFFYGGSWNHGSRDEYGFVGSALAARGVVAIVADYRLYPEVRYPDFLTDSASAVAWGFANAARFGANPRRVFVMGHSAGGYNAAMLALDPRWLGAAGHSPQELAGWIGLCGPYDLFPTQVVEVQPVFFHPDYPPHSQPIEFPSAEAPRTFLAAPVHDKVVDPVRSTRTLAAKLSALGVPVTLKMYERPSHATLIGSFGWPLRWASPALADVTDFIATAPPVTTSDAIR